MQPINWANLSTEWDQANIHYGDETSPRATWMIVAARANPDNPGLVDIGIVDMQDPEGAFKTLERVKDEDGLDLTELINKSEFAGMDLRDIDHVPGLKPLVAQRVDTAAASISGAKHCTYLANQLILGTAPPEARYKLSLPSPAVP